MRFVIPAQAGIQFEKVSRQAPVRHYFTGFRIALTRVRNDDEHEG
jgi:hypothetical protein